MDQWMNPDWINLDWINLDRGVGALVGALIAGAVALLIDQRRRNDESRNRYSEEKLRLYERMITALDIMGELQLIRAEFAPVLRRIENGEELDAQDTKKQQALLERLDAMLGRYEKYAEQSEEEPILKLSLLGSGDAAHAAHRVMKLITKMEAHADAGRYEKVSRLAMRYEIASASLLIAVRSDLGIRD